MYDDTVTITLPASVAVRIVQHESLIEKHNIGHDTFYTTSIFWDCECEFDFIQPAFLENCPMCNSHREDQPNARVDEILNHKCCLSNDLVQVVEVLADKFCSHLNAIPF